MDKKKVIKQMYKYIASRDYLRPVFRGVHFYEERCCATDSHVLVIYNETIPQLAGKTIDANGSEIKGRWPNVDSVFPNEMIEYPSLDLDTLRKALNWHMRKVNSSRNDVLVIEHKAINMEYLRQVLNLIVTVDEMDNVKMYKTEKGTALVLISESFRCLIMPSIFDEKDVDSAIEMPTKLTLSYDNLINDFAFNSWRSEKKASDQDWMAQY